jgi:hypothetical protein
VPGRTIHVLHLHCKARSTPKRKRQPVRQPHDVSRTAASSRSVLFDASTEPDPLRPKVLLAAVDEERVATQAQIHSHITNDASVPIWNASRHNRHVLSATTRRTGLQPPLSKLRMATVEAGRQRSTKRTGLQPPLSKLRMATVEADRQRSTKWRLRSWRT